MSMRKVAAAGGCLVFATLAASAQTPAPQPAPLMPPTTQYLQQRLRPGLALENFLQQLRNEFRNADADANGIIDKADAELHASIGAASMRAMLAMSIMRADIDNDGTVTEDELRRMYRYERRAFGLPGVAPKQIEDQIGTEVKRLMEADVDKDGRITYAEAFAFAKSRPENQRAIAMMPQMVDRLLVFAPEGKASVTLADIEPAAEALFRLVDTDNDGKLSQDEVKAFRERPENPDEQRRSAARLAMQERERKQREADAVREQKDTEARVACAMPKASDGAKVVLIGSYQAEAMSTATIGSQDVAVGVGNVMVDAGAEPIYLVLVSFRPTIWRFYGAVERIERLVLTSTMTGPGRGVALEKPLVGAVGIPAERVSFLGQARCINYFSDAPSTQAAIAGGVVKREAGKEVAVLAARYAFADVAVPAARFQVTRDADAGKLVIIKPAGSLRIEGNPNNVIVRAGPSSAESEFKRFSPGGLIEIDPKRVVASQPVEKYEVLPQQAGLIQLVKEGKLEENRSGEYLIKAKIRFPAELTGAHSVKFLLLKGVPMPDGNPGHSDVISEETGEKIKFEPKK